jgi:hypothetical protein
MVMNKHLLMWKAPLDSAMIDPDELQSYLDQGWKEVGWIVCEPSNLAGDTCSHPALESSSDRVRQVRNDEG